MKRFLALFLLLSLPAQAAEIPVEISAAQSLEWNRAAKTYTARKDVVAKKGDAEIRSNLLVADYTGDSADITKLTATGKVQISSPPYRAYGDKGVYDIASGNAVLTGGDLKVETDTDRLTAKDKIVYAANAGTLKAVGNATLLKDNRKLSAEALTAFFKKDGAGKMTTDRITADGNIVIETEKETVTGDAGTYSIATQTAELTGNVVIRQGESRLEGTRATVDMKTGISRLFGSAENEGRVKGVFYPKAK